MPIFEGFECGNWTALASMVAGTTGVQWDSDGTSSIGAVTTWAHTNFTGGYGSYSMELFNTSRIAVTMTVQQRYLYVTLYRASVTGQHSIRFVQLGVDAATITWNTDGTVSILRGTGTVLATSTASFGSATGSVLFLEIDAVLDNGVGGSISVYANNNPTAVVEALATDTTAAATAGWNRVEFWSAGGQTLRVDDVAFTTAAEGRLGFEPFIPRALPTSDSTPLELTPSSGVDHYALVNTIPVAASGYNEATAVNQEDAYGHAALGVTPNTVKALKVQAYVTRDGTITAAILKMESNGTTDTGGTQTLGASAVSVMVEEYFDTNPDGGGAWAEASADATDIIIEFA